MPSIMPAQRPAAALSSLDDQALVALVTREDHAAFEVLMRRHNTRLFRVARAVMRSDDAAEDVLQEGYLHAYRHIGDFRGDAQVGTWLTRIVINQALMRLRRERRERVVVPFTGRADDEGHEMEASVADERSESPQERAVRMDARRLLEQRIDELPVAFRTVFVMRDVEEMSVDETAECLGIPSATVRTRLFRARALLRQALSRDLDVAAGDVFSFAGARCDRIVTGVLTRLRTPA